MATLLESLARHSVIVADTGDFEAIARYRPRDATTNPSLILEAAQEPRYRPLVERALREAAAAGEGHAAAVVDALFVAFGRYEAAGVGRERTRGGPLDEASFRWRLNEDAMATEKLAEGIRIFDADLRKLLGEVAAT